MKWVFLAALVGMVPVLTAILRSRPQYLLHACYFLGLLLFFMEPYLSVAPVSWRWVGPVKGIEVTVLDAIAVSIIFATRAVRTPLGLKIGVAIYILALTISTLAAQQWIPSAFYGWQLLRAMLVFVAVARATAMVKDAPIALVAGLGTAMVYEALLATKQFLGGNPQPGGSLGHRNILGLTSHFVVMPAFALLLAGRRNLLPALVVFSGMVIALVGGSRATIGLFAIGLVITTMLSIRLKKTGRKGAFAAAAMAAVALSVPATLWAIERRSEAALVSSDKERGALTDAAVMVIADHPLGVGANQYLIVANVGGYSDRAGAAWNWANRSAPVHNSYLLVTAELGALGLIGMLTMLLSIMYKGFKSIRRLAVEERSELLVGLLGALIVVGAHLAYEWLFMTSYIHYLLAMNMGALVGIAAAQKRPRVARPRLAPAVEPRFAAQSS